MPAQTPTPAKLPRVFASPRPRTAVGKVTGRQPAEQPLKGERVLAGMNVNVWDVAEPVSALVLSRRPVDARRLTDPDVPLESVLTGLTDALPSAGAVSS